VSTSPGSRASAAKPPPQKVSAAELKKAHDAQREGLEGLRDWFNDWSTTLRQVFTPKAQLKLGLTTLKQRTREEEEQGEEEAERETDVETKEEEEANEEEPADEAGEG
jgi:hypothetical protein